MEWSGVEWSGVEWSGVEWSGVEWNGVEWSGVSGVKGSVEWSEVDFGVECSVGRSCGVETIPGQESLLVNVLFLTVFWLCPFPFHAPNQKKFKVENRKQSTMEF